MKIILGHKVGMTQTWDDAGRLVGATVIQALPNTVIRSKDITVIGTPSTGRTNKPQRSSAAVLGSSQGIWLKKADGVEAKTAKLTVEQFAVGEKVVVSGVTKGKGFAGVVKRHGFAGAPASHGHPHQRRPGSIGAQQPQRVPKGQKMPGHMGGAALTVRGNKVIAVDGKENLLIVSGAVPGANRSRVVVRSIN